MSVMTSVMVAPYIFVVLGYVHQSLIHNGGNGSGNGNGS